MRRGKIYLKALGINIELFGDQGCQASGHALAHFITWADEAKQVFRCDLKKRVGNKRAGLA